MSKPQKRNSWKKQYNEDNYRHSGAETRRVSFKQGRGGGKNERTKDWGSTIRAHLADEDIDMGANFSNAKYKKNNFNNKGGRGRRGGSPVPQRNGRRKLLEGPLSWYRVFIPYGNKYERAFITQLMLLKLSPTPLYPIMWSTNGTSCTFYVDEFKTAEKLHNIDREIELPDGFKLILKVSNGSPNIDINESMKEKMKLAMAKRYNAASKALDLTKFHLDESLLDVCCALFKPVIMLAVLDIIGDNIPELEALNLNDNKICYLSHMKKMKTVLPNLKILYLGNNKLREITQLDHLSGIPIKDLVLDGNPLCDKYKDQSAYISEVRKRFPEVVVLDGIQLPPPISFDIEEHKIPSNVHTFLCNPESVTIAKQFIEQYFQIMDSDNRQPLLQAYHEKAMFSMTMSYPYGMNPKNSPYLNWYSTDNRNILRLPDPERRLKLLKQGHLQVVALLQEMPATKHEIHSFTLDICISTPTMILMTVTGFFKEIKGLKNPPIRYFFRTFVVIPAGSGFCIANEQLHVSNATEAQLKVAFKTPIPAPAPVVAAPAAAPTEGLSDAVKQQMIQALCQESGMNLSWSQKCLEETNWDYAKAGLVFAQAKAQGLIPPDAFIK